MKKTFTQNKFTGENKEAFLSEINILKEMMKLYYSHTDKYKGSYTFGIMENENQRKIREKEAFFSLSKEFTNLGLKISLKYFLDCSTPKKYFEKKIIELNGEKVTMRELNNLWKEITEIETKIYIGE